MKVKLVKSKGCVSAVVDEKSYFSNNKGKLKGKIYIISKLDKNNIKE